jgi:uncharacterized protein YycO
MAGPRLLILNILTPVQKVMQRLGNPEPRISYQFVRKIVPQLKDGDILLSRENYRLTNIFVPGFWGHAAIYRKGYAIEAIGSGVRKEDIYRWLYQKDSVCVLRTRLDENDTKAAATIAVHQIGAPYDYLFSPEAKAFYCSELVTYAYDKVTSGKFPFKPRKSFGVETSTPQDLYNAAVIDGKFDLIFEEKN